MKGLLRKTIELNVFFCSKQWFDPVTPFIGCAVFLCWITADTCGFSLYFLLATTSSWFNIGSFWWVFPQRSNSTVFLSVWKPVERAVIEKVLPNTLFFLDFGFHRTILKQPVFRVPWTVILAPLALFQALELCGDSSPRQSQVLHREKKMMTLGSTVDGIYPLVN